MSERARSVVRPPAKADRTIAGYPHVYVVVCPDGLVRDDEGLLPFAACDHANAHIYAAEADRMREDCCGRPGKHRVVRLRLPGRRSKRS